MDQSWWINRQPSVQDTTGPAPASSAVRVLHEHLSGRQPALAPFRRPCAPCGPPLSLARGRGRAPNGFDDSSPHPSPHARCVIRCSRCQRVSRDRRPPTRYEPPRCSCSAPAGRPHGGQSAVACGTPSIHGPVSARSAAEYVWSRRRPVRRLHDPCITTIVTWSPTTPWTGRACPQPARLLCACSSSQTNIPFSAAHIPTRQSHGATAAPDWPPTFCALLKSVSRHAKDTRPL